MLECVVKTEQNCWLQNHECWNTGGGEERHSEDSDRQLD